MNISNKEVEIIVFNINSKALISMEKQKWFLDEILTKSLTILSDELQLSESSEDESDINISHQSCAKIYIQPPVNLFWDKSDFDSGNEEEPAINNLSGDQLLAPGSLKVKQLRIVKELSITSQMLSSYSKSELPSSLSLSSSSSSGENCKPKQKKRRYEKKKSTYPSKDTEKPSKR